MKPPDAMPIASRRVASLCSGWRRLLGNVPMPSKYHVVTKRKACGKRTYTFPDQNVYVSCPRRIRFTLETYTFSTQNVYVLLAIRIRFAREGYTSGSSPSKLPFSTERCTSPQEIAFIPNRTSLRKMPNACARARRLASIVCIRGKWLSLPSIVPALSVGQA